MVAWLGPALAAGSSLIGGFLNRDAAKDANAAQAAQAEKNMKLQQDFAQHGIKWRVDDAKDAGIHPLYALGAQTTSYSPVSLGTTADTSLGSSFASAGQDLSRAINATRTAPERADAFTKTVQDLSLTKMGLENEVLAAQVAKLRASTNPPMPTLGPIPEAGKPEERPLLQWGGQKIKTDPTTSNFDDFSKRYGDEGIPQWAIAPSIMFRDFQHNLPPRPQGWEGKWNEFKDILRWIDRKTAIW